MQQLGDVIPFEMDSLHPACPSAATSSTHVGFWAQELQCHAVCALGPACARTSFSLSLTGLLKPEGNIPAVLRVPYPRRLCNQPQANKCGFFSFFSPNLMFYSLIFSDAARQASHDHEVMSLLSLCHIMCICSNVAV